MSIEMRTDTATELECTRLGLHADDPVYRIHRVRQHSGRVFLVEDATLPAALFPGLAASKAIDYSIRVLAQEYGILLGKVEERISMGVPPAGVAKTLLVALDAPVMVLDRVVFMLDHGRPVEWRLAHCHLPDANHLAAIS
jgi:GntR family transcriptional regulator